MIIAGAQGFAIQLLPSILEQKFEEVYFYDDINRERTELAGFPVIGSLDDARKILAKDPAFALGVGSPGARAYFTELLTRAGGRLTGIISACAMVSPLYTDIGPGVSLLQQATVESFVSLGQGALINVGAVICHESTIGAFCEIGPRVTVTGNCHIGERCSIGAGAVILPGIRIGADTIIGAGAVVNRDIPEHSVAVGVPAKVIKKR